MSQATTPGRRGFLVSIAAFIVVLVAGVGGWFVLSHQSAGIGSIGGPFTLVDGDGHTVTDKTFLGRYLLVYFGYTFCPDVCPTTLTQMAAAFEKLGPKADKLQAVFITVDPARDTPAVVRDYAAAFSPRIKGLTGTPEQIAAAAREYRVYYAVQKPTGGGAYTVDHSSVVYLMGPDGRFVAPIRADEDATKMAAEISRYLG